MKPIQIDRFASATVRLQLPNPLPVKFRTYPEVGDVVVTEALTENPLYPDVEITTGERVPVRKGDVIAGVVGSRQALKGFVGYAPYKILEGDELSLLNMGGVMGRLLDGPAHLGDAIRLRLLGHAMDGETPFNIASNAVKPIWSLPPSAPILLVVGTCMHVGKTETATRLIEVFAKRGKKVCACKLSGVAALKDLNRMREAGAHKVMSFLDAGFPSTVDATDLGPPFKGILATLGEEQPDLIVVELGDGILGRYRVDEIVADENLMSNVAATIVCATDLAAALGARDTLNRIGLVPTFFSGPVTDTIAGSEYIEEKFGITALNAFKHADAMADQLLERVKRFREAA